MDFSERESSPKLSSSAESSVEFVAEIPGPDCEEESLTIVLTDSEDCPPKLKRKLTEYFTPARRNTPPFAPHIGSTGNASTRSTDTGNPGQAPKVALQIKQKVLLARENVTTPHTAYGSLRC